jgi:hypothetical protein
MKRTYDAEFFDGKCPYTDKPCYEWECDTCEVEEQEKEAMKAVDDGKYWEDAQEALSRIFDRCEEIDPQSGYDMLEDIQLIQGFINKHKSQEQESETVLYSGDGYADGYMVYDMAECPNCGYEYEEGDKDWGLPFCPNCGQRLDWESED